MKRILLLIAITALFTDRPLSAKDKKDSYIFGSLPLMGWVPYTIAEQKGFWKEQGLDMKVRIYANAPDWLNGFIHGKTDFVSLPLTFLVDVLNMGVDVTYLGSAEFGYGQKHLIVKKPLVGKSLKGEKVGIFAKDSSAKYVLAKYLDQQGLTLKDVEIVYIPDAPLISNFNKGRLNAIVMYGHLWHDAVENGGGVLVYSTDDYTEPFGLVAKNDLLKKVPEDVIAKIARGWFKATLWMKDPENWGEFKSIVNKVSFAGQPDFDKEWILDQREEWEFRAARKLYKHNQKELFDIFDEAGKLFRTTGLLEGKASKKWTQKNIINNRVWSNSIREFVAELNSKAKNKGATN